MMQITQKRRLWFGFSGVMVGLSVLLILILGFKLGLDYTGGVRWHIDFAADQTETIEENGVSVSFETEEDEPEATENAELETQTAPETAKVLDFFASEKKVALTPQIQRVGETGLLITLMDMPDAEMQTLKTSFGETFGEYTEVSYRKVDTSIGQSFQRKSFWAIVVTLVGIVLFVGLAFQKVPSSVNPWRFGAVAVVALFHDVIILLGVFSVLSFLLQVELDLQFITALLATLGFSVNDTIVILDRVRENIARQKPEETFEDTIEKSIQQTLRRSINTSISTLLPLLALLIWGASSIFYFILALVIGITVGTYSSIFLAAPLLAHWKLYADNKAKK